MLDCCHEPDLSEQLWNTLITRVELPAAIAELLESSLASETLLDSRRLYSRKPLRSIAIASCGQQRLACYAKDISRLGVGFYAPVNLLPKKLVSLWFPSGRSVQLLITRCRRVGAACFECGGVFHSAANNLNAPRP